MFWWKLAMGIAVVLGYGLVAAIIIYHVRLLRKQEDKD